VHSLRERVWGVLFSGVWLFSGHCGWSQTAPVTPPSDPTVYGGERYQGRTVLRATAVKEQPSAPTITPLPQPSSGAIDRQGDDSKPSAVTPPTPPDLAIPSVAPSAAPSPTVSEEPASTAYTPLPAVPAPSAIPLTLPKVDKSSLPQASGAVTSFASVVERVGPSVVSIRTTKTERIPKALRDFFGFPGSETTQGLGSGVIVSPDGYILTNNHVTDGADEMIVNLGTGKKDYRARKVGADPGTDIAVLKIDATNLPAITFADSDAVRVGDVVLAVGNPFGLTETVTMGIVSGLSRGGMGIVDYENFIQTDASINPGNSGGALVDTAGRLVGINTAIFSRTGGNQGIGFAVPANLSMTVLQSIRERGRVVRGYLGTVVQPVSPDLAEAFKLKEATGALVADVAANSPAARAGIQSGDVILALNGKPVAGPRELRLLVSALPPGSTVRIRLSRNGQEMEVQPQLVELPKKEPEITGDESGPDSSGSNKILDGVAVSDLTEETRQALQAPLGVRGAVVRDVALDSESYKAGLRKGFLIQEINRKTVRTVADATGLNRMLKPGKPVLLKIWSEGQTRYLTIKSR
jgi:serine protease Do